MQAGARVTQERLEMDQPLWPAYHITLEEFEAANGSTLSGVPPSFLSAQSIMKPCSGQLTLEL